MATLQEVIDKLHLIPLEGEGGMFYRPYETEEWIKANEFENRNTARPIGNSIYYLLTPNSFSSMHVLLSDEIWFHHSGPSINMLLVNENGSEIKVLGPNVDKGELPQIVVPKGTFQGAMMKDDGEYSLMSTYSSPSYCDSDYRISSYEELKPLLSDESHEELLRKLTGEIRFL